MEIAREAHDTLAIIRFSGLIHTPVQQSTAGLGFPAVNNYDSGSGVWRGSSNDSGLRKRSDPDSDSVCGNHSGDCGASELLRCIRARLHRYSSSGDRPIDKHRDCNFEIRSWDREP